MSVDPSGGGIRRDEARDRLASAFTIAAVLATISYPAWAQRAAVLISGLLATANPG
jgi:hypothetical protein